MKATLRAAPSPLCVTPAEAAQQLHIGRTQMYRMLKSGEILSVRVGRRILIPTKELEAWLHRAVTCSIKKEGGDADGKAEGKR